MPTNAEWATAYARQADADFKTFASIHTMSIPECHFALRRSICCARVS